MSRAEATRSGGALRTPPPLVLLGLILGLGLIAALFLRRSEGRAGSASIGPSDEAGSSVARTQDLSPSTPSASRAKVETSRTETVSGDPASDGGRVVYTSSIDYLSQFWGPRWEALRADLAEHNPDRLAMYEAMPLTEELVPPPLASVQDDLVRAFLEQLDSPTERNRIAYEVRADPWPTPLTSNFLAQRIGTATSYSGSEVMAAQQAADRVEPEFSDARDMFFEQARIDVEIQAKARDYVAWPLVFVGTGVSASSEGEPPPEVQLGSRPISLLVSWRGLWIAGLQLDIQQRPYLWDLWQLMKRLGSQRERDVREALRR